MPEFGETSKGAAEEFAALFHQRQREAAPLYHTILRPHRSSTPRAITIIVLLVSVMLTIPLGAFLGQIAWWVLFAFCLAALGALSIALTRNHLEGEKRSEELWIWKDLVYLTHQKPDGTRLIWATHPSEMKARLVDTPKMQNYLVLHSPARDAELGSFLTPEERQCLHKQITSKLAEIRFERTDEP